MHRQDVLGARSVVELRARDVVDVPGVAEWICQTLAALVVALVSVCVNSNGSDR